MKSAPVGSSPPANQGDFDLFRWASICGMLLVRGRVKDDPALTKSACRRSLGMVSLVIKAQKMPFKNGCNRTGAPSGIMLKMNLNERVGITLPSE